MSKNLALLLILLSSSGHAAVSPEEAAKLGVDLTIVGAEMAGNAAGTIPAYTGGLPADTSPPGFVPGAEVLPDPFANEAPRLVITRENMAQYAGHLTAVTQTLLQRNRNFRVDVYPTHRTVNFVAELEKNTQINATDARTNETGMAVENALPGVPFPLPQNGYEAMWNHLLRNSGRLGYDLVATFNSWNVDPSGVASLAASGDALVTFPLLGPDKINQRALPADVYYRLQVHYTAPARRAGEALLVQDAVDPLQQPRRSWLYLPGLRRAKLAPDVAYDTPNPSTSGASVHDDTTVFNGALDRFNWKMLGKREMYLPYNSYRLLGELDAGKYTTAQILNPDYVRWELRRVWMVEATLKEDKRHVYSRRVFYLDEDSWSAIASDQYDARGQLYRGSFAFFTQNWETRSVGAASSVIYDLISGAYNFSGFSGAIKYVKTLPEARWSPEALAGTGVR